MSSSASHWKSAVDPRTSRTYFYHEITRETQWRKPMELASDVERRTMEEKEKKQKDFFSSMEANILNSLSQGVVPGTPNDAAAALKRKKSSRAPITGDERPELVRTISTMDVTMLRDLIRRQPSYRDVNSNNTTSTRSIQVGELETGRRGSAMRDGFGGSFVSIKSERQQLDPLAEGFGDDSLPELFSYLPDGDPDISFESSFDMGNMSNRSDGGKFNESSNTGFGLTWEETQALKKLASITKEMIDVESEDDLDLGDESPSAGAKFQGGAAGATPSWKAKESKAMRDLPREIEFDDDSESEVEATPQQSLGSAPASAFQKPKDIGGARALPRELDFEDSDDSEAEPNLAPTPMMKQKSVRISDEKKSPKTDPVAVRPEVRRRNTCGTLYVGTTMSAPDKDATIKCVCGVYRTHILSSEVDTGYNPAIGNYTDFNDLESQQGGLETQFHNNDSFVRVPSLDEVTRFYRDIFFKAQMETDCIIMSLIYVERLIKRTLGGLRPRACNWRSLLFSCMIMSSKVWDDLSMWNADFSQSCPPGVSFTLQRINQLELSVLHALTFQVKVPASEYAKYYFLLRSMLIKSGLGGDEMGSLNPLDVMGARRLQQVSAQFESLSVTKSKTALQHRSKSMHRVQDKSNANKAGLEHVVKM